MVHNNKVVSNNSQPVSPSLPRIWAFWNCRPLGVDLKSVNSNICDTPFVIRMWASRSVTSADCYKSISIFNVITLWVTSERDRLVQMIRQLNFPRVFVSKRSMNSKLKHCNCWCLVKIVWHGSGKRNFTSKRIWVRLSPLACFSLCNSSHSVRWRTLCL